MTLRHFQIFISVCDEQGMTQAAQKLHISQPSISQAVKELEEHYQVRLFERLGKKLFLTPAGQELLHYARHIISLSAQTEKTLRSFSLAAPIRLGATLSIGESIFIDIITRLKKSHAGAGSLFPCPQHRRPGRCPAARRAGCRPGGGQHHLCLPYPDSLS